MYVNDSTMLDQRQCVYYKKEIAVVHIIMHSITTKNWRDIVVRINKIHKVDLNANKYAKLEQQKVVKESG